MAELACEFCHRGDPAATTKDEAHAGMWRNPTDLRVVRQVCGQCHQTRTEQVKRSLHATSAGIISAARYTWAAQDGKEAIYATYEVTDRDGRKLLQLPSYDPTAPEGPENHPVDDYLRAECLRCHIWTRGKERDGDWRASGCAACHVIYADDGRYVGGDQAIDKGRKGYPMRHEITVAIPSFQCIHCHNRGGRTGVSFIGTMESAGYGSPWAKEPGQKAGKRLHGKFYDHLTPDLHYERGLSCIDCHSSYDVHGDGLLRDKKEEAVEIECQDCHGDQDTSSNLRSSLGRRIANLHRDQEGRVVLVSKLDGKEHLVPQVVEIWEGENEAAKVAMFIPAHAERLECYACHARWAPQCYGCHAQQDLSTLAGDWLEYDATGDPSVMASESNRKAVVYRWWETRSYLRWERPALGINAEGRVAPYVPGCQVIFTQAGRAGQPGRVNHVFVTSDGTSGLAMNPIQPHTVSTEARSCESCHASSKALGLGDGIYDSRANGIPVDFGLDAMVDERGRQLQTTSHAGARPFTIEEMDRISRVGSCAACHGWMLDLWFWRRLEKGVAGSAKAHYELLKEMTRRLADEE